jgi:hypothetical protein
MKLSLEENMKKIWKWVLGILVGLLVVALIGSVVYLAVSRGGGGPWMMGERSFRSWGGGDDLRRFTMPMHPGGWFNTRGFAGFFLLRMLFGGLFWVGLITLSVIGVVSLLRRRKGAQPQSSLPGAPAAQMPAPEPSPAQPRTCANCAHTVQDDWSHCPYCGNTLT